MILMFYFNVCYQCIQRWLSFSGNIFLLTQTPLLCSKCSSSPCILAIIYTLLLTQGYNYRSTPLCCLHHQVFSLSPDQHVCCLCCYCCCSVAKLCLTLCDPMNCSTPDFPVLHYLLVFAQIHIHWIGDVI